MQKFKTVKKEASSRPFPVMGDLRWFVMKCCGRKRDWGGKRKSGWGN